MATFTAGEGYVIAGVPPTVARDMQVYDPLAGDRPPVLGLDECTFDDISASVELGVELR
ncbi:hypothetical protein [Nocardia sp. NPDC005745]|uniref:hypothetical protein n=1 Tax=Nocardia sp. NPDC005745 TaxID=3157061 RepID=UPI0033DF1CB9